MVATDLIVPLIVLPSSRPADHRLLHGGHWRSYIPSTQHSVWLDLICSIIRARPPELNSRFFYLLAVLEQVTSLLNFVFLSYKAGTVIPRKELLGVLNMLFCLAPWILKLAGSFEASAVNATMTFSFQLN